MENITAGVRGEWLKFKFLKSRFGAFCDFFYIRPGIWIVHWKYFMPGLKYFYEREKFNKSSRVQCRKWVMEKEWSACIAILSNNDYQFFFFSKKIKRKVLHAAFYHLNSIRCRYILFADGINGSGALFVINNYSLFEIKWAKLSGQTLLGSSLYRLYRITSRNDEIK